MEPVEAAPGQATTEAPSGGVPTDVGSPVWIGGELLAAVILAVVLAYAVRVRPPAPNLRLPLPEEMSTEDGRDRTEGAAERSREDEVDTEVPPDSTVPVPTILSMLQNALARSREALRSSLDRVFGRPVDPASYEQLEEALLQADVGVKTTEALIGTVRTAAAKDPDPENLRGVLKGEMKRMLGAVHAPLAVGDGLWVVLVVGVNGSGKTTTIGKLAARFKAEGRKVLLAAGDTFRAAAEQQLGVWADRAGVDVVALDEGADPGAVAFTAVERARKEGHDVVIVDTAGRLQTRKPLMEQLGKVRRVLDKACTGAPQETLLVLDGTMGQNALSQARLFNEVTPVTGVVVTKLDGTAKGGMVLAIATELGLPVKLVGLGEKVGDLRDFDPDAFVDALA
jgi:fused signal recognition particle receptor